MKETDNIYRLEIRYDLTRDSKKKVRRITRKNTFHGIHADNPSALMDSIGKLSSGIVRKKHHSKTRENVKEFIIRFIQTWKGTYEDSYQI